MMFWKSSSSSSASSTSASKPSSTNNSSSALLSAPGTAIPTYILSEQRRNELLLAARANRVSWIDGVDEVTTGSSNASAELLSGSSLHAVGKARALGKHAGTSIPAPCQQALEVIATDLHEFFGTLDTLKSKIIPNSLIDDDSMRVREPQTQANSTTNSVRADGKPTVVAYRTIFQDLFENEALLAKWQRTQGHEISSPVRRKRMTGDDREMVFLLAFRELIAILKNPKAAELVYQIQSFVKKFDTWDLKLMLRQRVTREKPGGYVQAFIEKLVQQLRRNDKLLDLIEDNQANDDNDQGLMATEYLCGTDEWSEDLLREVLEAFLMEKVYVKALTPSPQSANEDRVLFSRLQSLAFVEFKHLDLPTPETEELKQKWHHLVLQLKQMPLFMSPRRKMDCVLRVCQDLTKLLASQKADGKFPSADEFLPGLIFLLLKANPKELKRNLNFILEYRNPSKLVSEPGYFFTHLVSSVAFLEQVNGSLLTISPEEFEEGLRRSKQQILMDIETSPTVVDKASGDADGDKENKKREKAQSQLKSQNPALPNVLERGAAAVTKANCAHNAQLPDPGDSSGWQLQLRWISRKADRQTIEPEHMGGFLICMVLLVKKHDEQTLIQQFANWRIHGRRARGTSQPASFNNSTRERDLKMRFVMFKTQERQPDASTTPPPHAQQQQSYLQRMCNQFASLRESYTSRHSTKENASSMKEKTTYEKEHGSTSNGELSSIDEDVVYRLNSDFHTASPPHKQQSKSTNMTRDDTSDPTQAKKEQQPLTSTSLHLLSWGEAKSRIQQTTTMLRDVCVTKSSALLSTAWRVVPGSKQSVHRCSSSSLSSSSGADTPPPKRSSKEQQCEQWLMTAGRESEISICMSYYSSCSLSDAANTDSETDYQQTLQMMTTAWRHRRTSSGASVTSRALSENESDPFRRRCSSDDSYMSTERGSIGVCRNVIRGDDDDDETKDNDDDKKDFGEETIRESLFLRDGKLYAIRNEWF